MLDRVEYGNKGITIDKIPISNSCYYTVRLEKAFFKQKKALKTYFGFDGNDFLYLFLVIWFFMIIFSFLMHFSDSLDLISSFTLSASK